MECSINDLMEALRCLDDARESLENVPPAVCVRSKSQIEKAIELIEELGITIEDVLDEYYPACYTLKEE